MHALCAKKARIQLLIIETSSHCALDSVDLFGYRHYLKPASWATRKGMKSYEVSIVSKSAMNQHHKRLAALLDVARLLAATV